MPSSLSTFLDPPTEFSVLPFWFWNDDLDADEIRRQIADFEEHGVYGFIIHPRVGLPRSLGWMSEALLEFYDAAIEEAGRRGMQVVLYDEGMYPSGSSAGQVVAENPGYQTRCLEARGLADGEEPTLQPDEKLVAVVSRRGGGRLAVIDRKMDAYIRGLHYIDGGPAEDEPLAGDLLNPEAVACFIRLVYDKFYERFGQHFGGLIPAIFTDEPSPVGKPRERGVWPGTTGILAHVNRLLGYDFTPHLAALWHDDEPDADRYRADYERAIALRMEETWYAQLYDWCSGHGIALTGHPAKADDLGAERYFHMPGPGYRLALGAAGRPDGARGRTVDAGQMRQFGDDSHGPAAQRERTVRRLRPRADVGGDELAGRLVFRARHEYAFPARLLLQCARHPLG